MVQINWSVCVCKIWPLRNLTHGRSHQRVKLVAGKFERFWEILKKEVGTFWIRRQHLIRLLLPPPQCWCSLGIYVFKKIKSMGNLSFISESCKCYVWYPELGSKKFFVFAVSPFFKLVFKKCKTSYFEIYCSIVPNWVPFLLPIFFPLIKVSSNPKLKYLKVFSLYR